MMTKLMRAIGLMSGTSIDGIDVALIETDGINTVKPLGADETPYSPEERKVLRYAIDIAAKWESDAAMP